MLCDTKNKLIYLIISIILDLIFFDTLEYILYTTLNIKI